MVCPIIKQDALISQGKPPILTTPLRFDDSNLKNVFEYLEVVYIAWNYTVGHKQETKLSLG